MAEPPVAADPPTEEPKAERDAEAPVSGTPTTGGSRGRPVLGERAGADARERLMDGGEVGASDVAGGGIAAAGRSWSPARTAR
jgi:hypothetical protein